MYNALLLAAETVSENTANSGITLSMNQMKVLILIAVVIIIAVYVIVKPTPEKTERAKKYLNNLATQIMQIVFANIDYKINSYDGTIDLSFDDFKQKLLDVIYEESWSFVQASLEQAIEKGELDSIVSKYIKKESVESLVNIVVGRDDVHQKFVDAFNVLFDKYNDQMGKEEEQDAAFAEEAENQPIEDGDPADPTKVDLFADSVDEKDTENFNPTVDEIITDPDERDNDSKSVG